LVRARQEPHRRSARKADAFQAARRRIPQNLRQFKALWQLAQRLLIASLNSRNDVAFSVTVNFFITGQRRPP
jgi:hypothetical protein